ncbi:MAG: hypothetical protein WAM65_16010, partial [Candidatus Korobacteraceae bacterium]
MATRIFSGKGGFMGKRGASLAVVCIFAAGIFLTMPLAAQTFAVLHTFSSGQDGATPYGTLALDAAGNLYGTASAGGSTGNDCTATGCGTV